MNSPKNNELIALKRRALSDPLRLKMWEYLRIPRRKHSAHSRAVIGSAGSAPWLRGECLCWRPPGPAEHEVVQDVHGVLAVLAGGVDVAADVEAVLGDVVAGQAAGDLLLGFQGADAALADVVRSRCRLRVVRVLRSIRIGCG